MFSVLLYVAFLAAITCFVGSRSWSMGIRVGLIVLVASILPLFGAALLMANRGEGSPDEGYALLFIIVTAPLGMLGTAIGWLWLRLLTPRPE